LDDAQDVYVHFQALVSAAQSDKGRKMESELVGIFTTINTLLAAKGLLLKEGTVVDATIIEAPSSTKIKTERATRRCIKPRRATNGILG
jgi:hypothetical protein